MERINSKDKFDSKFTNIKKDKKRVLNLNNSESSKNLNDKNCNLICTLKNELQEVLQDDPDYIENINYIDDHNLIEKKILGLENKDFELLIKNLDENLYGKDYKEFIVKINNNLQNYILKPKYFGVNLKTVISGDHYKDSESKEESNISKKNINSIKNTVNYNKLFEVDKIKDIFSITDFKIITPLEVFYKHEFEKFHKISNEKDKCSICLFEFYEELFERSEKLLQKYEKFNNKNSSKNLNSYNNLACEEILKFQQEHDSFDVVLLEDCKDHFFHIDCLMNLKGAQKEYIKCPNCNSIYGIMTGDQPPGSMSVSVDKKYKCEGYNKNNTLIIQYNFPNGKNYKGTSRTAYLPDNQEGREILALFRTAFERKLLFTIGTSVTTGLSNQTIWNGVHQKTNLCDGPQYFGYPDPTYFNRVRQELAAKGIIKEHIEKNISLSNIAEKFIKDKFFSNIEDKRSKNLRYNN